MSAAAPHVARERAMHDIHVHLSEPTATHAAWGAGDPMLHVSRDEERFDVLLPDLTLIGEAPGCTVRLRDAEPIHARIDHDAHDEYVLTMLGPGTTSALLRGTPDGPDDRTMVLRTGSRFTIGAWSLVFHRDEYADHGHPYGGRSDAWGLHPRTQPARPDYTRWAEGRNDHLARQEREQAADVESAADGPVS